MDVMKYPSDKKMYDTFEFNNTINEDNECLHNHIIELLSEISASCR